MKDDHQVPIGVTRDGIPVYELPPELAALLADPDRCAASTMGDCEGEVTERGGTGLDIRLCARHRRLGGKDG